MYFKIKKFLFQGLYFLFIFLGFMTFAQENSKINIMDFGAVADGLTLNTKSIQEAIDQCSKNGGGTVDFPAGNYLTGTLQMRDNVVLNLMAGCKILGSTQIKDYPMYAPSVPNNMDKDVKRALIRGENLSNIGIIGMGIIDGQGTYLQIHKILDKELKEISKIYTDKTRYIPNKGNDQRPFLLRFVSCKNINIQGITLQHPAKWTQHYLDCDGLIVRDVKVYAHGGENNDLIDIDGSKNVLISGLKGDSDDDGICLKSTGNQIVENVIISDCIIRSRTNPIKTGTDSFAGFRNITISNCFIGPSLASGGYAGRKEGLAGIALEMVDGGILENVTISNIVMQEMAAPIFIRLGNRGRTPKPNMEPRSIGSINNINISNIVATNAGRTGCSIIGEKNHPITNISMSNIQIHFDGGGTLAEANAEKPELVNEYPECTQLGNLPAYGFFVRHVNGITFRDVNLNYKDKEYRPAMLFKDVQNLKILNFNAEVVKGVKAQIVLQNSSTIFVNGCSPKGSDTFLAIESNSKDINITGNNFSNSFKPIYIDNSINTSEIKTTSNLTGKTNLFEILQPNIKRDSLGMVNLYYPNKAEIFYTTDGSSPTKTSKKYINPFENIDARTIKAIALKKNQKSTIATLKLEKVQVLSPIISPKNQFFNKNIEVKLFSNTKGASIFYTLDGTTPTKNSLKYTRALSIKKSSAIKAIAFKEGYKNSMVSSSQYKTRPHLKGVQYQYYEMKLEKLPNFIDLIPVKVGLVKKFSFEEVNHAKFNFAILMHGFLKVKNNGVYQFYLSSNDGSILLLDNKVIINNDNAHGTIEKTRKIHLTSGEHLIEVQYFQAGGGNSLKVSWKGVNFEKHEINKKELTN